MADDEMVDGAGWISDESSFYGDEETVAWWEKRAKRQLHLPSQRVARSPAKKRKIVEVNDDGHDTAQVYKTPASSSSAKDERNLLDFLKSRPQIANLQNDHEKHTKRTKTQGRTLTGEEASELVGVDHFKGCEQAWQHHESINDFLKRLPVADPDTARVGPWLWVSCPKIARNHQDRRKQTDVDAFIDLGEGLKDAFIKRRSRTEAENPGKAPATITRKMRPYRDQLEQDLLSAAVKTGTTCGKWMLFPNSSDLPRYWRVVAEATSEGRLGPVCKVATPDPYDGKDETLICVYTYDFTDMDDVRRVLNELLELNLCRRDGKPIFYKCDAYTYMNITSNNDYRLRASLYSSAELFKNEAKATSEGPVARLKKRSPTIDSFFSS